jgi:hypothetical protein
MSPVLPCLTFFCTTNHAPHTKKRFSIYHFPIPTNLPISTGRTQMSLIPEKRSPGRGVKPQITSSPPHRPQMKNDCQRESTCRQRQEKSTFPLPITTGALHTLDTPLPVRNYQSLRTHRSLFTQPLSYTHLTATNHHGRRTPLPITTGTLQIRNFGHPLILYIPSYYQSRRSHLSLFFLHTPILYQSTRAHTLLLPTPPYSIHSPIHPAMLGQRLSSICVVSSRV